MRFSLGPPGRITKRWGVGALRLVHRRAPPHLSGPEGSMRRVRIKPARPAAFRPQVRVEVCPAALSHGFHPWRGDHREIVATEHGRTPAHDRCTRLCGLPWGLQGGFASMPDVDGPGTDSGTVHLATARCHTTRDAGDPLTMPARRTPTRDWLGAKLWGWCHVR
jgi:hypothetical protein